MTEREIPQSTPTTIDDYIAGFPSEIQVIMQQLRATIHAVAPDVEEAIAYKMPTFNLSGKYLVYFAGYKNHIGFYGAPRDDPAFDEDLSPYESGQGTLRFPYDKPIPYDLIAKIVAYRAEQNRAAGTKKKKG
jgi:uncharacterized protein YdhG (YjbR/CyaY superfamily)